MKKKIQTRQVMLWFAMGSIAMFFAGLTSAYIVSSSRADWLKGYALPTPLYISAAVIALSSITLWLGGRAVSGGEKRRAGLCLWLTLLLAAGFVACQFMGFSEIVAQGYFLTGPQSNVTTSYIYTIAIAHLLHVAAGIVVLLVVAVNFYRNKYAPGNALGFALGSQFWHFLGGLWVYLLLFFVFANKG